MVSNRSRYHHVLAAGMWGVFLVVLFCLPVYGQVANDECTTATVIPSIPFIDNVNTTLATNNPADPSLSCNFGGDQTDGRTVWYTWTPQDDVTVQISTFGSDYDTVIGVYTGACNNLFEVACVDVGLADAFMFDAEANVTYFIKVGEFRGGEGGGNLVFRVGELEPIILESVRDGVSAPISSLVLPPAALSKNATGIPAVEEVPMFMLDDKGEEESLGKYGPMMERKGQKSPLQKGMISTGIQAARGPSKIEVLQIFDGAENDDNDALVGFLVFPPDTDGDVGLDHYVQMTNLVTTIFDKSGNTVLGPFPNNVFWTGLGGLCEFTNNGDPIVLYDEETDRWLVSQFAFDDDFTVFSLCIAGSETGDPTGAYFQHEFDFTGIGFPDYPKYGFATDAIGVMVNLFIPFQGSGLGAIDKAEAFSNQPTTMVFFKPGTNEFGFVAGDNDGPVFDNMPPTFATNNAGVFVNNRIDFWEIAPDFAVPANSTAGEVASIPVTPFDSDLCPAIRERCIDQPEGAPRLEAITDRLMHRLQLRDFGNDKRAVVTHTVDANGNGKAGKRWYEFRNHQDRGWRLFEENTFSPDGDHRWMGSIAMNTLGETSLGYSISSSTTYPSIGVAGRRGRSSHMNLGERIVFDGNVDQHVQLGTQARWGDYSAMAVDPVDGTFWYTQEYARPNTRLGELAGWATKIVQFRFKGGPATLAGNVAEGEHPAEGAALQEVAPEVPAEFALAQNYPNPFNPATEIRFALPEAVPVQLVVYNVMGQQVVRLVDGPLEAGRHTVTWDAAGLPSGTYLFRLTAGAFTETKAMTLLK